MKHSIGILKFKHINLMKQVLFLTQIRFLYFVHNNIMYTIPCHTLFDDLISTLLQNLLSKSLRILHKILFDENFNGF